MNKSLLLVFIMGAMLFGCNNHGQTSPAVEKQTNVFNTSDKAAETNGNILVAMKNLSVSDAMPAAEDSNAETLTKSPFSALGKVFKIKGKVYKVEELPPSPEFNGKWSEILMMTKNQNSAVGATTIDFVFNGDVSKINSGAILSCSGHFIGIYTTQNAMGGNIEALAFVGNSCSPASKK